VHESAHESLSRWKTKGGGELSRSTNDRNTMPILPLDHPEPFAATLGVMLYPAMDKADPPKARAFAAQWLGEPLRRLREAGHLLTYDALERIAIDAGQPLIDLNERWQGGLATGDLFKTLYTLAKNDPALASWENAVKIYEVSARRVGSKGSRTTLLRERDIFLSVAHLWGAWSIREGRFAHPEVGYDGYADFQSFLTEAEILRDFGQNWRPTRSKSKTPLPPDVWRVPEGWKPPTRSPGWPQTAAIPDIALPDALLALLKPAGRPRTRG
jgi:hypothetical protein